MTQIFGHNQRRGEQELRILTVGDKNDDDDDDENHNDDNEHDDDNREYNEAVT